MVTASFAAAGPADWPSPVQAYSGQGRWYCTFHLVIAGTSRREATEAVRVDGELGCWSGEELRIS